MKVTIRGKQRTGKTSLAQAIADTLQTYLRIPVSIDGVPNNVQPGYIVPEWPLVTEPVEIITRNDTDRPTSTPTERARSYVREACGALHDLVRDIHGREDLSHEIEALEFDAKALACRLERALSHRKWLADRGLPH